jgi:hypothetical protein
MDWIDLLFLIITWVIFLAVSRNIKLTLLVLIIASSICIIFNLDIYYVVPISFFVNFIIEKYRNRKNK